MTVFQIYNTPSLDVTHMMDFKIFCPDTEFGFSHNAWILHKSKIKAFKQILDFKSMGF
jgi:hypothetical protein